MSRQKEPYEAKWAGCSAPLALHLPRERAAASKSEKEACRREVYLSGVYLRKSIVVLLESAHHSDDPRENDLMQLKTQLT
jgi:hypothetical protein